MKPLSERLPFCRWLTNWPFGVTLVIKTIASQSEQLQRRRSTHRVVRTRFQSAFFVHCGIGQRACSLSVTASASGVKTNLIFEQARELGFPVQDEKLRTFLKSL
jgi:hypothetical protein